MTTPTNVTQEWRLRFPEKVKDHRRKERQKVKNNLALKLLRQSQTNAWRSSREWSLTIDDIKVPSVCPVFKVPFKMYTPFAASVDRIDSSKGYTPGNIQIISRLANSMKQNATPEQLIAFAKWVLETHG